MGEVRKVGVGRKLRISCSEPRGMADEFAHGLMEERTKTLSCYDRLKHTIQLGVTAKSHLDW